MSNYLSKSKVVEYLNDVVRFNPQKEPNPYGSVYWDGNQNGSHCTAKNILKHIESGDWDTEGDDHDKD
jgi:hypothetical protein